MRWWRSDLSPHGEEARRRQVYAACVDLAALPSPDDAEPVIGRAFARPVGIAGRTMRPRCSLILRDAAKAPLLWMRPPLWGSRNQKAGSRPAASPMLFLKGPGTRAERGSTRA